MRREKDNFPFTLEFSHMFFIVLHWYKGPVQGLHTAAVKYLKGRSETFTSKFDICLHLCNSTKNKRRDQPGKENSQSSSAQTFMTETHSPSHPSCTDPTKIPVKTTIASFNPNWLCLVLLLKSICNYIFYSSYQDLGDLVIWMSSANLWGSCCWQQPQLNLTPMRKWWLTTCVMTET